VSPIEVAILYVFMGVLGFLLPISPVSEKSYRISSLTNTFVSAPGQYFVIYLLEGIAVSDITIISFAFLYSLISVVASLGLTNSLGRLPIRGSVVLNSVFMNAINLPLPILQALTGSSIYAASFSVGLSLAQLVSSKILQTLIGTQERPGVKFDLRELIRFVPLMMVVLGSVAHYAVWLKVETPALSESFETLLTFLLSLNFLYFGTSLQKSIRSEKTERMQKLKRPLLLVGIFRTIVGPLITIGLAVLFFSKTSDAFLQLVFVGAMPPAITNTILSGIYGFDEGFSATSALIMTPICVAEAFLLFYGIKFL